MTIKAIETRYQGYRFRSRLEARWAVFFDTLGIRYEYEPEGFDLGDAGRYLPDFWLPEHKAWFEIKGTEPNQGELRKADALFEQSGDPVFIAIGEPGYGELWLYCIDSCDSGGGQMWWEECRWMVLSDDYNKVVVGIPAGHVDDRAWFSRDYEILQYVVNEHFCQEHHGLSEAFAKARSARFEYGESG